MKKITFFLAALFACAMSFSCQTELEKEPAAPVLREFTLSMDATKEIDTKALAVSSDGKTLSATWEEGDQVAVCKINADNGLSAVIGMIAPTTFGTTSTVLRGNINMDGINPGDKLFLQYPYKTIFDETGNEWLSSLYSGQNGDLGYLSMAYAYATCGVDITDVDDTSAGVTTTTAKFYNRQAIVKFALQTAGAPLDIFKLRIYAPGLAEGFWHDSYYIKSGAFDVVSATAPRSEFTVALHNLDSEPQRYTIYAVSADNVYFSVTPPLAFADGTYNRGTGNLSPINYESCSEYSEWSLIGSFAEYNVNWGNEFNMWSDGQGMHVAAGVRLKAGDEFKFRKDQDWGVNLGGPVGAVTDAFALYQDGANCSVFADGVYDIYLDTFTNTAVIVPASNGGKTSTLMHENQNPNPVTGWNLIGLNDDWDNDVRATEVSDGIWEAEVRVENTTYFKWRKDGDWENRFGGTMTAYDEPFMASVEGDPIKIDPGHYKIVLDFTTPVVMICVYVIPPCWSLIGTFNNWSADVDMVQSVDGTWVSPPTRMYGDFKLRWDHGWDVNLGAGGESSFDVPLGVPFSAVEGGQNLTLPGEGSYIVTYDPSAKTILVEKEFADKDVFWENAPGAEEEYWSGNMLFALEEYATDNTKVVFSQALWNRIKTETFYLDFLPGQNCLIRICTGWWDPQWKEEDIKPGDPLITDNGDGTMTLKIDLSDCEELIEVLDIRGLIITGSGFTPLRLYFK